MESTQHGAASSTGSEPRQRRRSVPAGHQTHINTCGVVNTERSKLQAGQGDANCQDVTPLLLRLCIHLDLDMQKCS